MALRRWIVLMAALFWLWPCRAQLSDYLPFGLEEVDDEVQAQGLLEQLGELADQPININDPTEAALLPFVEPFQLQALRNYISLHGELLSMQELAFVPGWDSASVALARQMAVAERLPHRPSLKQMLRRGRHALTLGLAGTVEQAAGYTNGHYEGDNLRALLFYRFKASNHIEVRFAADKDPAEAWGKGNFYGFHLVASDFGRLEKLVVGRFDVQFAQGLTLWTGYAPYSTLGRSVLRSGSGLKASSAFAESGFCRGIGATVRLGRGWHTTAFGSAVGGDLLAGLRLEHRSEHLLVGATAAYSHLADSLRPSALVYRQLSFVGKQLGNFGIDMLWQWGPLQAFAELSIASDTLAPAAIAGLRLSANADNRVGIAYRYRSAAFHNLYAHPFAMMSYAEERGFSIDATALLPWDVRLATSLINWRSGGVSYADYGPSAGWWMRASLVRSANKRAEWSLRYSGKLGSRNYPQSEVLYSSEATARHVGYAMLRTTLGSWRVGVRLSAAASHYEYASPTYGGLALVELVRTAPRWSGTMRLGLFRTDDSASRLYAAESLLPYNYALPALYGRGLRAVAVLKWTPRPGLMLAAQYCLTYRFDVKQLGSGDALIDAPHRQQWALQLRWQF